MRDRGFSLVFWAGAVLVLLAGLAFTGYAENEYYFTACYVVLQGTIMAVAWNILGGFTGYVNFGSAGFFATGVYTSIALYKAFELPLPLLILAAAVVCGALGLAAGYLTLRLKGVYFAIATLAMAIVLETFVVNWDYVGGASGTYILTPEEIPLFDSYIELLFMVMLVLAVGSVAISRWLNRSRIGLGLSAIRDEETAAECAGVPTLRLKLLSTVIMGAMMGVAGAPYPFFVAYVDPVSAFNLLVAVNAIAMPMIGGTATWLGPVVGALLLGSAQEYITVTVSSELNLLIVGGLLVLFITLAPQGIVGLVRDAFAPESEAVSAERILEVQDLSKSFGGFVALNAIELHLDRGERLGLIGPNGSGKTTLINCISGALRAESGSIGFEGREVSRLPAHARAHLGIARSFQIPKPFRSMTVLENLHVPLEYAARHRDGAARRGAVHTQAMEILTLIGLEASAHASSAGLTQVDMRKLELARALAARPSLLVADEAMAGLSSSEVDEILRILMTLNERGVAVIMIEHIMRAVMGFSERIVVLDAGRKIADGAPREVIRNPDVERAYLGE